MNELAENIWRDFTTLGVPSSGSWKPRKDEIRKWGKRLESAIAAGLSNGGLIYDTKVSMDADLAHDANASAWVMGGADAGIYRKSGASGSGSWSKIADLPYSFIPASNLGAGTANAIVATTSIPVPAADGAALIALPIAVDNTTSPVTVTFNGGGVLTIKTVVGTDVSVGALRAGSVVAGYKVGSTFRLFSEALSLPGPEAYKVLAWNSTGTALENRAVAGDGTMMQPVYDPGNVGADVFDSANQRYDLGETNAIQRSVLQFVSEGRINVRDLGVKGDGSTDDTSKLKAVFERGGSFWIPQGDYLIAPAGPDAGGVEAILTKNLDVLASPDARFFSDGLDNDIIRLTVPLDGIGLPVGGVSVSWDGGYFDLTAVKNSTSVPHSGTFPPANLGSSATTDALSVRGSYLFGGVARNGLRSVAVRRVRIIAGDHWQSAGGDSGIYCGDGADVSYIEDNYFQGTRDVAVYASRDGTGIAGGPVHIRNNKMVNCFFAATVKRGLSGAKIIGNTAVNCVSAWLFENVSGGRSVGGVVSDNNEYQCGRQIGLTYCTGVDVTLGTMEKMGPVLEDGLTPVNLYSSASAIYLAGAQQCRVRGARIVSVNPAWSEIQQFVIHVTDYNPGAGAEKSSYNMLDDCIGVIGSGLRGLGGEAVGAAEYNTYRGCKAIGSVAPNLASLDNTSVEERRTDGGNRIFRQALLVGDGNNASPAIARENQSSTGIFLGANMVGISAGGTERMSANNRSIRVTIPTYADDTAASGGGLSTGELYKTSTGEMRVKI